MRFWLSRVTGERLAGREGGPRVGPFWSATSTDAAKTSSQPASRGSRERPSPQTAGEGPFPGGGRPPQHPTRHHEGEQRHSYRASTSSTSTQLRKTDTLVAGNAHPGCRRQWFRPCAQVQSRSCACVQIGAWAGVGPVLTPVRRLRHRQCHFSAGAAEGKFAHRISQNHAQAQSSAKSTPTPQNRSAPPTTGRPCASPSPSLRSTSASAWAALSPQRRARSRHPGKAGRSSTTTQLRKTDTLVAGSAHPGWRRHWCRPCARVQSWSCACVRIGVWACAGGTSRNGERGRQDRPGRTAGRRRPPVPTSTALPARALFIARGAFRRLIAAGAPTV